MSPHSVVRARSCALSISALAALLPGCALTPSGTDAERARLEANADRYEPPFPERSLPELPQNPSWEDLLHRAFLANGELEAAYFEWKAALERVDIASAWPNTNVALGFQYMFSRENMKTFDRITFSAGFDAMENLALPPKVAQAGHVALDGARAAGERFRAAKFRLQEEVLTGWTEYTLIAERERILTQQVQLLQGIFEAAQARVGAGGAAQDDLLRAEIELATTEDALATARAELEAQRAMLNGLLARRPEAPLAPPGEFPAARGFSISDSDFFSMAADANPELAALARTVEGRQNAIELARLQWLPDINPMAGFTGAASQMIGAMVMLPTTIREIRGAIEEAKAMTRAAEAMLRQASHDRASAYVAALVSLRDSERRRELFESRILPSTDRALTSIRASYTAGRAEYIDLIEAQRALLDVQLVIAEARAMREVRLAELERLAGVDVETMFSTRTGAGGGDDAPAGAEVSHHD